MVEVVLRNVDILYQDVLKDDFLPSHAFNSIVSSSGKRYITNSAYLNQGTTPERQHQQHQRLALNSRDANKEKSSKGTMDKMFCIDV